MAGPTPWDDGEDVLGLICRLVKLREKVFVRVGLGGFSRASLARRREVGEIDRSGGVINSDVPLALPLPPESWMARTADPNWSDTGSGAC